MSAEEAQDVKVTFKKWIVAAFIAFLIPFLGATGAVINFYYETVNSHAELKREVLELKDELNRSKVKLESKVSTEEMKDFKDDMKSEMKDIKGLLNILLEKK